VSPPCVLVSGGETTVTLGDSPGRGGPNTEFATSAGIALATATDADRSTRIVVASVDTDGIDGTSGAAGGIVDATTFDDATLDTDDATPPDDVTTLDTDAARAALDRNDVAPLLAEADALVRTGPTGTNVNDLRVLVVDEA